MLIRYSGQHVQHMQKALEQMNVKLTELVSDVSGLTGMATIRAILRGERNPLALAKLRNVNCKRTEAEIARALYGNWRAERLFALQHANRHATTGRVCGPARGPRAKGVWNQLDVVAILVPT
jgi:hypothetical protein